MTHLISVQNFSNRSSICVVHERVSNQHTNVKNGTIKTSITITSLQFESSLVSDNPLTPSGGLRNSFLKGEGFPPPN